MKKAIFASLALTLLAAPALAAEVHCDADLKAIEQALIRAKLSPADAASVKAAQAKAEALHKAGKEEECEKSLLDTQKLLGIQEQHKE